MSFFPRLTTNTILKKLLNLSKDLYHLKCKFCQEISTCTNKHFLRKIEVFIRFDSFLMYTDIHTKSQNFLKISMFSNKIFTLTSRAQLYEKVKISHKISIFFPKKLTVLHRTWCWEKHSLLYPKGLHDLILSLYLKIHSFGQKLTLFA